MGFGRSWVSAPSLVPRPPARMTAFLIMNTPKLDAGFDARKKRGFDTATNRPAPSPYAAGQRHRPALHWSIAAEALLRIAALYAIEAGIRGSVADRLLAVRQAQSAPLVAELEAWLHAQLNRLSRGSKLAEAIRYGLRHWQGLSEFLSDGRLEMDTNTVEREIRPVAVTRKAALFAGSEGGGENWAIATTLIRTAILNGVDPQAWLTDVLEQMVSGKVKNRSLASLLPWAWRDAKRHAIAA